MMFANLLRKFRQILTQELLEQVSQQITQMSAQIAQGFAQIVQRLETDLVGLSNRTHQLTQAMGDHSSVIAKLIADQNEIAETIRGLQHDRFRQQRVSVRTDVGDRTAESIGTWVSSSNAALPPQVLGELKAHKFDGNQPCWTLTPEAVPLTADELPILVDLMRDGRRLTKSGDRLVWVQPVDNMALLTAEEMRQVLGLLGPIIDLFDVKDQGRNWRVAVATARTECASLVLRWTLATIEALHLRLGPVIREKLRRFAPNNVLHAIDLPEPDADFDYWASHVAAFANLMAEQEGAVVGIVLPARFAEAPELMRGAVAHVRDAMRAAGRSDVLTFQWVRGSVPVSLSSAIIDFAQTHAIRFDFTAVSRGSTESRLESYQDLVPYYPLRFDLRAPFYAPQANGLVEIARWSGRGAATERLRDLASPRNLTQFFDRDFERACARLVPVLDRVGQRQFELQANLDPILLAYWPEYFIYNWSSPPPTRIRLFEFEAGGLFEAGSPLARLYADNGIGTDDARWADASRLLQLAAAAAKEDAACKPDPRQLQIAEHAYQHDRKDITADAERLVNWMPDHLGATLELGCGLGVMAHRIRGRADLYVGFDLTIDQAQALRGLGVESLVADIHTLPFRDAAFDSIVADNVVEHASDPMRVLLECMRVLRSNGSCYLIIPYDLRGPDFCNPAHFWKADETSVGHALQATGFEIVRQETVRMSDLGISGAYPSCDGYTGLWQVRRPKKLARSGTI
jgi:Methyltransferase domain